MLTKVSANPTGALQLEGLSELLRVRANFHPPQPPVSGCRPTWAKARQDGRLHFFRRQIPERAPAEGGWLRTLSEAERQELQSSTGKCVIQVYTGLFMYFLCLLSLGDHSGYFLLLNHITFFLLCHRWSHCIKTPGFRSHFEGKKSIIYLAF